MAFDAHKNFAYGTVLTAPTTPTAGTSLVLNSGQGAGLPAAPFNGTVWPAGSMPTASNAEIVRVTAISTDTLTIVRSQEGSSARSIIAGDQFAASITAKTITDLETRSPLLGLARNTTGGVMPVGFTTYATLTATSKGGQCVARVGIVAANGNSGAERSFDMRVTCDGVALTPSSITPLHALLIGTNTTWLTYNYVFDSTPAAGSHTWNFQVSAGTASAIVVQDNYIEVSEVTGA